MATEWYYARDGRQFGPVTARKLKQLAQSDELRSTDLVWKDGMPDWKPAATVQGLFPVDTILAAGPLSSETVPNSRRRSRSITGLLLLCIAAIPMIVAACVPWWSMTIRAKDEGDHGGYWMRCDSLITQAEFFNVSHERNRGRTTETQIIRLRNTRDDKGNWAVRMAKYMKESERNLENLAKAVENCQVEDTADAEEVRRDALRFLKSASNSKKWWDEHLKTSADSFSRRFAVQAREVDREKNMSLTIRLWGIGDWRGLMGLEFGILIFVLTIIFMAVPVLRNWGWIISLMATVMGVLVLIFSLIWILTAPGDDPGSMFRQGVSVGPYLLLGSAALFLLTGMLDTIFGISHLVRRIRLRPAT